MYMYMYMLIYMYMYCMQNIQCISVDGLASHIVSGAPLHTYFVHVHCMYVTMYLDISVHTCILAHAKCAPSQFNPALSFHTG